MTKYFIFPTDTSPNASFERVRWLDCHQDYELAAAYWAKHNLLLPFEMWNDAQRRRFQYAARFEDKNIISCTAIWRFSAQYGEISAVTTLLDARRKGYARQVISFLVNPA